MKAFLLCCAGAILLSVPQLSCAETVCMKEPDARTKATILELDKDYYGNNEMYRSTIKAALVDINGDGVKDVVYTDMGRTGSCGNSYAALLGSKGGEFKLMERYLDCVGTCLTLEKRKVNGFRIVTFGGRKFIYNPTEQAFEMSPSRAKRKQ